MAPYLNSVFLFVAGAMSIASAAIVTTPPKPGSTSKISSTPITTALATLDGKQKISCETFTYPGPSSFSCNAAKSCSDQYLTTTICSQGGQFHGTIGQQVEITTISSSTVTSTYSATAAASVSVPDVTGLAQHAATQDWTFSLNEKLEDEITKLVNEKCMDSGTLNTHIARRDPKNFACSIQELIALEEGGMPGVVPADLVQDLTSAVQQMGGVFAPAEIAVAYAHRGIMNVRSALAALAAFAILQQLARDGYLMHVITAPYNLVNQVLEKGNMVLGIPEGGSPAKLTSTTSEGPSCPVNVAVSPDDDQGEEGYPEIPAYCTLGTVSRKRDSSESYDPDPHNILKRKSGFELVATSDKKRDEPKGNACICSNHKTYSTSEGTITKGPLTTTTMCPWTTDPPSSLLFFGSLCQEITTIPSFYPFCTPSTQHSFPFQTDKQCNCPIHGIRRMVYQRTSTYKVCDPSGGTSMATNVCAYLDEPAMYHNVPECSTKIPSELCEIKTVSGRWNVQNVPNPTNYCLCSGHAVYLPSTTSYLPCKNPTAIILRPATAPITQTCAYYSEPPGKSVVVFPIPTSAEYGGGTYPPMNLLEPQCYGIPGHEITGYTRTFLEKMINSACDALAFSIGEGIKMKGLSLSNHRNSEHLALRIKNIRTGDGWRSLVQGPENLILWMHFEKDACPVGSIADRFAFYGPGAADKCKANLNAAFGNCPTFHRGPGNYEYFPGGSIYGDCVFWEVSAEGKYKRGTKFLDYQPR